MGWRCLAWSRWEIQVHYTNARAKGFPENAALKRDDKWDFNIMKNIMTLV